MDNLFFYQIGAGNTNWIKHLQRQTKETVIHLGSNHALGQIDFSSYFLDILAVNREFLKKKNVKENCLFRILQQRLQFLSYGYFTQGSYPEEEAGHTLYHQINC